MLIMFLDIIYVNNLPFFDYLCQQSPHLIIDCNKHKYFRVYYSFLPLFVKSKRLNRVSFIEEVKRVECSPLMYAHPHLRAQRERAMEILATKKMWREQDIYMQSNNYANKNRFIQAS